MVFFLPENRVSPVFEDYVHTDLHEECAVIAGHYVLTQETRHPFDDREILYFVGCSVLDNSCCGYGNFSYALVPGFIVEWKYKMTAEGFPVSKIELIRDQALKKDITSLLMQKEFVSQVNFL